MTNRLRDYVVTFGFVGLLVGMMLANLLTPDKELSFSERRRLRQAPEFSTLQVLQGKYFLAYEEYLLDQFVLREQYRGIKAAVRRYGLQQLENNGVIVVGGNVFKPEYPLKEQNIIRAADKFNEVRDMYFAGNNVYYSVIPDKSLFAQGYLRMDYARLVEILGDRVEGMNYIDILGLLRVEDYYRTDLHWRQERLIPVADMLLRSMGWTGERGEYQELEVGPFYGSYFGRAALPLRPDTITYLVNGVIAGASVYDYELDREGGVYALDMLEGMDSYSLFLAGPKALLRIENPAQANGRELVIFRDSFGSSIAPLLIEAYSTIYLVDIRYIPASKLGEFIQFHEAQDVLFLLSTPILNNSLMLR